MDFWEWHPRIVTREYGFIHKKTIESGFVSATESRSKIFAARLRALSWNCSSLAFLRPAHVPPDVGAQERAWFTVGVRVYSQSCHTALGMTVPPHAASARLFDSRMQPLLHTCRKPVRAHSNVVDIIRY